MLIDAFQQHFDRLWQKTGAGNSRRQVILPLTVLRDRCPVRAGLSSAAI